MPEHTKQKKSVIVVGDVNIDLKDKQTLTNNYIDLLVVNGFIQCIQDYTRVAWRVDHVVKSLLDHLFIRIDNYDSIHKD